METKIKEAVFDSKVLAYFEEMYLLSKGDVPNDDRIEFIEKWNSVYSDMLGGAESILLEKLSITPMELYSDDKYVPMVVEIMFKSIFIDLVNIHEE